MESEKPKKASGLYRHEFLSKKSDIGKMLEEGYFLTEIHKQLELKMPIAAAYYYANKYLTKKNAETPSGPPAQVVDGKELRLKNEDDKPISRAGDQSIKIVRHNPNPNIEDLI